MPSSSQCSFENGALRLYSVSGSAQAKYFVREQVLRSKAIKAVADAAVAVAPVVEETKEEAKHCLHLFSIAEVLQIELQSI